MSLLTHPCFFYFFIGSLLGGAFTASGCSSVPIDPGTRPASLIAQLDPSALKDRLSSCQDGPFYRTRFSIAHRGAPLGYPEHTREGYIAAASMGAGRLECDVTFTKDLALVCRHSQCDLHRTTNILKTPLAEQCSQPFTPATTTQSATAQCCASDITVNQFKSLCGRQDRVNPNADSVDNYLRAPPPRMGNAAQSCGRLLTLDESISLFETFGVEHIPELKKPQVPMPYQGMDQQSYANRMISAYTQAGVDPKRVWPQSFNLNDVKYWIREHPQFANQTIYLDPRGRQASFKPSFAQMQSLKAAGIDIIAPPIPMLLELTPQGDLAPTDYAVFAQQAGLDIVTWTFESGQATDPKNWLYGNLTNFMDHESKMLLVLDALSTQVGIKGIFSDWAGTVTYYANCLNLPR